MINHMLNSVSEMMNQILKLTLQKTNKKSQTDTESKWFKLKTMTPIVSFYLSASSNKEMSLHLTFDSSFEAAIMRILFIIWSF